MSADITMRDPCSIPERIVRQASHECSICIKIRLDRNMGMAYDKKKMHPTSHSIFALAFSYTSFKKIGHFVIPTSRSWEAAITQLVQRYAGRS